MKLRLGGVAGAVLTAGAFVLYTAFAHHMSSEPQAQSWAILLALLPLSLLVLGIARQQLHNTRMFLLAAGAYLTVLAAAWPLLHHELRWVYLVQNLAFYLTLGLFFGRTLLAGRQPLCTGFACILHPVMHPQLEHYTRRVTQAWTAYFCLMALVSLLLFWLAPPPIWSWFANILTLPLVGLMFALEYLVRIRVLPPEDHLGLTSAFRAYRMAMERNRAAAASSHESSQQG